MPIGRPLGAKLLIEGKEVPFIGATITHAVGQASIAYIDVVPHAAINNIKPRTHVTIAVRDYNNNKSDDKFPYIYAWEGEVFGYSFGKTPGSRSFTLQCIDLTSYWDNALTYFLNPTTSLGKGGADMIGLGLDSTTAEKSGISIKATSDSLTSYLYETIRTKSQSSDFLEGFAEVYRTLSDVNEFYQLAEQRLRIFDRVLLQSSGKLNELLDKAQAFDWFSGIVGRTGGFASLRSVVQDLMSIIFHDFCTVPFPARVEKSSLAAPSVSTPDAKDKKYTIGQFLFKPNLYMIPPPVCNIFFPDEYSNFQYSRNFFKEPTRLIYKPELPLFLQSGNIALSYQFQPDSYQNFMMGKKPFSDFTGTDDFSVSGTDPGKYGEQDTNATTAKVNNKIVREGQFLTNEEKLKGIWMAQESMMPAATNFQESVADPDRRSFVNRVSRYLFFKKRFENRSLNITAHLKLSIVPGFNVLLLDDSDSKQSTLAYCSSVTHRIYATEGGYTNVQLSYARTVEEEKVASNNGNDPLVPPWFDESVFGTVPTGNSTFVGPPNATLSDYYKKLLGEKGYKALTDYFKDVPISTTFVGPPVNLRTVGGATDRLIEEYRQKKSQGGEVLQSFIADVTARDYIRIRDSFAFLGASLDKSDLNTGQPNIKTSQKKGTDLRNTYFNVFSGGAFDTSNSKFGEILSLKMKVIDAYRDALLKFRGFRG